MSWIVVLPTVDPEKWTLKENARPYSVIVRWSWPSATDTLCVLVHEFVEAGRRGAILDKGAPFVFPFFAERVQF